MGRKRFLIPAALLLLATLRITAQNGPSGFEFIENKGQWQDNVRYKGELVNGAFFLEKNGFTVVQHNSADLRKFLLHMHGDSPSGTSGKTGRKEDGRTVIDLDNDADAQHRRSDMIRSHAYNLRFLGASDAVEIVPEKPNSGYNNYYLGNDPSKWTSHVQLFQAVTYRNLYPNIDVRYYSEYGRLKYDIIVRPGGDVSKLQMRYQGQDKLSIRKGELVIGTSVGEIRELAPYSYQFSPKSGRAEVKSKYRIGAGQTVYFDIDDYDHNNTLIIDPSVVFCSFTGSSANQWGFTATPGPDGTLYSGGIVFGTGFPVSPGAYQTSYAGGPVAAGTGGVDVGIFKFSANGANRVYATYLGGDGNEAPHSMITDAQGNLIVMGRTYSGTSFPGTLVGAGGACDIYVTKFNSTGTALIGSLRIGSKGDDGVNMKDEFTGGITISGTYRFYGDDSRSEIVLDAANNIYVASQTHSGEFPASAGSFQPTYGGGSQDGVVMKLNSTCTAVQWASFLGGSDVDGAFVISVDPTTNNIFVGGSTNTQSGFPGITAGVYQTTYQGGITDAFVSVINNSGTTLLRSSYMGTSGYDAIYGIQFDRMSRPYIMGVAEGTWPVMNAAYSNPGSKQFVAKLKNDLSGFDYSTVFGSGNNFPNISPVAFLVDRCENVYISGWGGWLYPGQNEYRMAGTAGMPITADARKSSTDNRDFYFIVLKKDAASLLYGTFFGQDGGTGEHVDGGTSRFDEQGVIYQAICANCDGGNGFPISNPFPTTPGVWSSTNPTASSGGCNLAAVKIAFNFAGVGSGPKPFIQNSADSVGCVPATIEFRDTVLNAKRYIWNFGDGSPDVPTTSANVSHTYNSVGRYQIMLIGIDSTTCNIYDTAYTHVIVRNDQAFVGFNAVKLAPCDSLSYQFDNLSTAPAGKPFGIGSFVWDFGDGTRVSSGPNSIRHYYTTAGTYKVRLILSDTNYCNSPDSMEIELRIAPLVDAQFNTPLSGCVPYDAVFENVSEAGQQFIWDFGDGTGSTSASPVHTYTNIGSYTVKLLAIDSATCNIVDSVSKTINVYPNPTAEFSITPPTPVENTPTAFFNQSTGGSRYKWIFGDGDSTVRTNMDTVMHQYNASGTYNACLVTYNQYECSDTACHPVQAIVVPLLDVPNAFTPGRFGKNAVVKVEGFGIAKMNWKIFNRWGQLVFESNDRRNGWDGTFKGKLQPMDVYAYTLDVEFTDGTKTRKTGDITLIR